MYLANGTARRSPILGYHPAEHTELERYELCPQVRLAATAKGFWQPAYHFQRSFESLQRVTGGNRTGNARLNIHEQVAQDDPDAFIAN